MTVLAFIVFEILNACLPALLMACEIPHNHRRIDAPRRVVIKCRLPIQRLVHPELPTQNGRSEVEECFFGISPKITFEIHRQLQLKFDCEAFSPNIHLFGAEYYEKQNSIRIFSQY
jgi:hypothetical protein